MAGKNKKTGASTKKNKHSIVNNIIVVSVLLVIGIAGIYFGINHYRGAGSDLAKTVELPTINTPIYSSSTGEKFYLSADVMLLFENPNTEDYDNLKKIVTGAVSSLDYDGVTGDHNIDYVKEHIKSALSASIQSNVVANIYITDLQSSTEPIIKERNNSAK